MPDLSLTRMRQLLECIASTALQQSRLLHRAGEGPNLFDMTRQLERNGAISRDIAEAFHVVRKLANPAVHEAVAQAGDAMQGLKMCRAIAIWFHRLSHRDAKLGGFVRPPDPATQQQAAAQAKANEAAQLSESKEEIAQLQEKLEELRQKCVAVETD
ncbi:MAG: hypothetical protein AAF194_08610, partial [Pseudomonadota bacterium]